MTRIKRRLSLVLAGLLLAVTGLVVVGASPASASPCQIPGGYTTMVGVHRTGCVRVDITYCLVNQNKFWFSWWIQDMVDPGSDADRALFKRKWAWSSTWVEGGSDQNSADWYPNSGYFMADQNQVGPAGQISLRWKFSDEPAEMTFYPNYLSTGSC
jgi:hypothetical protein